MTIFVDNDYNDNVEEDIDPGAFEEFCKRFENATAQPTKLILSSWDATSNLLIRRIASSLEYLLRSSVGFTLELHGLLASETVLSEFSVDLRSRIKCIED